QMVDKLKFVTDELEKNKDRVSIQTDRMDETIAFLRWLEDHNFTFMGYKDYDLKEVNGDTELVPAKEKGLGLFADDKR
ncbi:NAD-glutamate dehydrogenase, partial [Escherichia coli]|nr:NAD-glutamate dehydrogenase [Escherichia coli]